MDEPLKRLFDNGMWEEKTWLILDRVYDDDLKWLFDSGLSFESTFQATNIHKVNVVTVNEKEEVMLHLKFPKKIMVKSNYVVRR
jgi:hypothetical protein